MLQNNCDWLKIYTVPYVHNIDAHKGSEGWEVRRREHPFKRL